ncbi:TIGR01459 family HAD-type hydrolase [Candidatus Pelagibacter bacterium]|nr:TIGR01459 family HAD-type hydrolase [Candidatus Pelagibacter bacterium]MDC0447520.1 TIGR01459 family HAD-type hydrolase [Pelagibacteraceae bacterium]
MRELNHLSEVFDAYDTFVIDLWGVIHDGISLNEKAIEAVDQLKKHSKKIVFLSNAPRPSAKVVDFLLKMKIDKKYLSNIMTSGEAAMHAINKNKFGKKFFHLGPPRDATIFEKVKENKTIIDDCDFILCTGLFDEDDPDLNKVQLHENDLDYYKKFLIKHISKKLVCTNPDLIVHRGNKEEYCAGYIAKIFEEMGGKVIYYGKPYKEIYEMCFEASEKVLAIGDNLRTDIKGANNLNKDCIFISNGVHRNEFESNLELEKLLNKYKVKANFFQKELKW